MSVRSELLEWQRNWAESSDLSPDAKGYLPNVNSNLFRPMSPATESAFDLGGGSELLDGPTRPAKMKALHSSSALAVNFFDAWVSRDRTPLQDALGVDNKILGIFFERQYSTGLSGIPPNLDVVLELEQGSTIAIESKFSEWLTPKPNKKKALKSKYFPEGSGLWAKKGLAASEKLAGQIRKGDTLFRYLDAPQLLKHALGLVTQLGRQFSLWYIYMDWLGKDAEAHSQEIDLFAEIVGEELNFRVLTYQEILAALRRDSRVDRDYLDYLEKRYRKTTD